MRRISITLGRSLSLRWADQIKKLRIYSSISALDSPSLKREPIWDPIEKKIAEAAIRVTIVLSAITVNELFICLLRKIYMPILF